MNLQARLSTSSSLEANLLCPKRRVARKEHPIGHACANVLTLYYDSANPCALVRSCSQRNAIVLASLRAEKGDGSRIWCWVGL